MRITFTFLTFILLAGCAGNSQPAPSVSGATKCNVRFLNLAISEEELLKEITAPGEVLALASFADKQISNASTWCHMAKVADRSATLNVSFYAGSEYKGTLGLGNYEKEKFFLKFHAIGVSKVICITNDEKEEFLRLIGVSPEEFKRIFPRE
ncbi:MAG: hypothetical protein JNK38_16840 [Acidobacteria bacterium]|nr:hypothetical protein [Acidobacteriota bacterium]